MNSSASDARSYVSPLRAEQTALTQHRIIEAGYVLFIERGYGATTMAEIAKTAQVSTQTVYNTFGSKAALLKRIYDVRLVGDDLPIPLAKRPHVVAMYADPDAARFLQAYARLGVELMERLGPLLVAVTAGAGAGDADLVAHLRTIDGERLVGATMVARRANELGALRSELSVERAADIVWTLNSVEVWELLTGRRGWSTADYEGWLGNSLCSGILAEPM
ncbi:TetR/AcrR family transcriptional regulator [Antrihabitans sp. YC3-6]|uniref:TetR/AcrR family transcriptional regulator n=1 Tax=Antrihabitans stalagmiti TaxID=2799499 RepID=A0A934NRD7_9NOCA|nr:TetR/AcrR family transcriptional regulator [Antrihabitans stalagmiti]MBJ8339938.1 TetR/AcrR family transcriptional regulator [Antrihabitans stalagmiti]